MAASCLTETFRPPVQGCEDQWLKLSAVSHASHARDPGFTTTGFSLSSYHVCCLYDYPKAIHAYTPRVHKNRRLEEERVTM